MILHGTRFARLAQAFRHKRITGMIIDHGQRMAVNAPLVSGMWPLKSICHKQIGRLLLEAMPGWLARSSLGLTTAVPAQDLDAPWRAPDGFKPSRFKAMRDLAGAPSRMLDHAPPAPALRSQLRCAWGCHAADATDRPIPDRRPPAPQPFVADLSTDAEPPAQLPPVRSFLHCQPDKLPRGSSIPEAGVVRRPAAAYWVPRFRGGRRPLSTSPTGAL